VRGIRLVIEEFRADVTKTLKDGSRGKLRIDYGDPKDPKKPIAWLWKFVVCRAVGYGESMSICPVWCAGQVLRAPHNHSASRKTSSLSGGR
jgi:hypothetical protein